MRMRYVLRMSVGLSSACLLACSSAGGPGGSSGSPSLFAQESKSNFRLSLTDAPKDEITSVFVNVSYAEMRVAGKGKEARLIVAKDLGAVDLLTLQNGVTLPMADLNLPDGVDVTQIRLILKSTGNYIVKKGGEICQLQAPSAEKTGIKLLIKNPVHVESGYNYAVVVDFDAAKSVVLKGNGGCLLKPVLKLKTALRQSIPVDDGSGSGGENPGPVDVIGSDDSEPGDTGGSTGGNDSGVVVPPPVVVDDGWDATNPDDNPPLIDQGEIRDFLNL